MKALPGKKKKRPGRNEQIRKALLAKIHIAKAELGYDDDLYRMILRNEYGVDSSACLSNAELLSLVARFQSKGWSPSPRPSPARGEGDCSRPDAGPACAKRSAVGRGEGDRSQQVEALKERVGQELLNTELDEKRFRGLLRKICGVHDLAWCKNVDKLKRLLAVIRKISDRDEG